MKRCLLIDQGNTRLKLAWRQAEGFESVITVEDIDTAVQAVAQTPQQVWLSSVAQPSLRARLVESIEANWGCPCITVSVTAFQHHQPTQYDQQQLGVDRWLALLACRFRRHLPCVVVDCGTAITVDLLDDNGVHSGGYILPGLALMREALLQGTAIPEPSDSKLAVPPARDTATAIHLGGRLSVVAMIERQLALLGPHAQLFLGGGDARELSSLLTVQHAMVEQMVLLGLARLSLLEEG